MQQANQEVGLLIPIAALIIKKKKRYTHTANSI